MIGWILAYTGIILYNSFKERKTAYYFAESLARSAGKPLIVVGGNNHQILGFDLPFSAHGCGDICIDIDPNACKNGNFLQADIREIPLPTGYAGAVFCSHVLEHLPTIADAEKAYDELTRIADNVVIVYPDKFSISAWTHPDHHLWVFGENGNIVFEQR